MNVVSKLTNASLAVCGSCASIAAFSAIHGESADAVRRIAPASHGNLLLRTALRASSVRTPISPMIRARCCESCSHVCTAFAATCVGESPVTNFRTAAASSCVTDCHSPVGCVTDNSMQRVSPTSTSSRYRASGPASSYRRFSDLRCAAASDGGNSATSPVRAGDRRTPDAHRR